MLKYLKNYSSYLKIKKEFPNLSYQEFLVLNDKKNQLSIPQKYSVNSDSNLFRLFFIETNFNPNNINKSFVLERPSGLSQLDVFKLVSYLRNKLSFLGYNLCSQISEIEHLLIRDYSFRALAESEVNDRIIVDMYFTKIKERSLLNCACFSNYFNWFINNVSEEEYEEICNKIKENKRLQMTIK